MQTFSIPGVGGLWNKSGLAANYILWVVTMQQQMEELGIAWESHF
jgi:hypothetical protein